MDSPLQELHLFLQVLFPTLLWALRSSVLLCQIVGGSSGLYGLPYCSNSNFRVIRVLLWLVSMSIGTGWPGDEHTWLLPSKIALIALVYSSFKLIWAAAIIIIPLQLLLLCCNHLFKTKNYQSMLNQHFAITTRIASRNHFAHKLTLYWHSLSFLEALDFNCSIFPQVLAISTRWKQPSLMTKAF